MNISEIQSIHKGSMAFVVGSGPSIHYQNINPLSDYITIAINASIAKISNADYFLSDDEDIINWSYYNQILAKNNTKCFFYIRKLKNLTKMIPEERIIWFDHKTWYNPITGEKPKDGLFMTDDASLPIIGARNSLASAIHIAYIMKCNPIVILGADCCLDNGKKYYWQFDNEPKVYRTDGKSLFYRATGKINNKVVDNHTKEFLSYWNELAEQTKKQNINIINASGGIMESFPRMTLEEILKKYGNNRK